MIYLDNSATTLKKPKEVSKALKDSISSLKYANPSRGSYDMSIDGLRLIYNTRKKVAKLFHIDNPLNIAFTPNVTYSINLVLNSLNLKKVVTTDSEHNSVLRPLYYMQNNGLKLSFLELNDKGEIVSEKLKELIKEDIDAIVITACSNVTGNITDLDKIYNIIKDKNILMIVDLAQLGGVKDINLSKYNNSIFCFTGHKSLYGPQGIGGIIVNADIEFNQVFSGGSGHDSFLKTQPTQMPDVFEYGTQNIHSIAGLSAGLDYILKKGMNNIEKELIKKTKYFYNKLKSIDGVKIYGNHSINTAPIVSMNYKDINASKLSTLLWEKYKIATRAGSHCAPRLHNHFNTEKQQILRFSFSTFTTYKELDYSVNSLKEIIGTFI